MKPKVSFLLGSSYFFKGFNDFKPKDRDELCIVDKFIKTKRPTNVLNMRFDGKDVFFFRDMTKEEFIQDTLESNVPMRVGKFLIPEFCQYINFTIDDLKKLAKLFNRLDAKHKYERLIYGFYLENRDFILTQDQLQKVYDEYKRERE